MELSKKIDLTDQNRNELFYFSSNQNQNQINSQNSNMEETSKKLSLNQNQEEKMNNFTEYSNPTFNPEYLSQINRDLNFESQINQTNLPQDDLSENNLRYIDPIQYSEKLLNRFRANINSDLNPDNENLIKGGYYEYTENITSTSKGKEYRNQLYRNDIKGLHLDDLNLETYYYPKPNVLIDNNLNKNNDQKLINNPIYQEFETEKSFNNKIEEILEKRNLQVKESFLENHNSQINNFLKEIEFLNQKIFDLESSNLKYKDENEYEQIFENFHS